MMGRHTSILSPRRHDAPARSSAATQPIAVCGALHRGVRNMRCSFAQTRFHQRHGTNSGHSSCAAAVESRRQLLTHRLTHGASWSCRPPRRLTRWRGCAPR